jgi:hypothetical protein
MNGTAALVVITPSTVISVAVWCLAIRVSIKRTIDRVTRAMKREQ